MLYNYNNYHNKAQKYIQIKLILDPRVKLSMLLLENYYSLFIGKIFLRKNSVKILKILLK